MLVVGAYDGLILCVGAEPTVSSLKVTMVRKKLTLKCRGKTRLAKWYAPYTVSPQLCSFMKATNTSPG